MNEIRSSKFTEFRIDFPPWIAHIILSNEHVERWRHFAPDKMNKIIEKYIFHNAGSKNVLFRP